MQYAILCFTKEELTNVGWTQAQDDKVMKSITHTTNEFNGAVRCAARLQPVTSAVSIHKGQSEVLVVDGPFIESKEHFVGFYVVECGSLENAVDFARGLMKANPWGSGYEIRPIYSAQLEP